LAPKPKTAEIPYKEKLAADVAKLEEMKASYEAEVDRIQGTLTADCPEEKKQLTQTVLDGVNAMLNRVNDVLGKKAAALHRLSNTCAQCECEP